MWGVLLSRILTFQCVHNTIYHGRYQSWSFSSDYHRHRHYRWAYYTHYFAHADQEKGQHWRQRNAAGTPTPTMKRSKKKKEPTPPPEKKKKTEEVDDMEYVMVRFLRPVEEPFMGLDEIVYGPFQEEDIATIPTANAKVWLRDGTVTRIVPSNAEDDE